MASHTPQRTVGVATMTPPDQARRSPLPVSVGQIVAVQVAAVATVATYHQPDAIFIPVLLTAVLLTAAMFARRQGRWWYEDVLLRWRLHRRTRQGGPAPVWTVREITDRGARVGLGLDETGFFTVLSVAGTDGDPSQQPDLDSVLGVLDDAEVPASARQLIHHQVPLPTVRSAAASHTWIALRLDANDATGEAASRGGGLDGVHRALTTAIGRVGKTLRAEGIDCQPLTAAHVTAAVATVAGQPDQAPEVTEHWHGRETQDASYACFRMTGTFSLTQLAGLVGDSSVLSYTLSVRILAPEHRDGTRSPQRHGLLQVGAAAGMLDSTVAEVAALAQRVGCRLRRLDGWHGPSAYAAAPTGAAT